MIELFDLENTGNLIHQNHDAFIIPAAIDHLLMHLFIKLDIEIFSIDPQFFLHPSLMILMKFEN